MAKKQAKDNHCILSSLYQLNIFAYWEALRKQPISVWAISLCIMNEYLRIQGLIPFLSGMPVSKVLFIIAVITWFANTKEKYTKDNFLWLIVFLFIVILASSFAAFNSEASFNKLDIYINWLVFYFLIVQTITTETRLLLFTWFIFLPIFKMSLFGARTWAGKGFAFDSWGISGPEGYFENSGELSLLMVMFFAMSVGLYIGIRKYLTKYKKMFLLLLPLTAIMTVLASATRGSQLALLVVILIFSVFYKRVNIKTIVLTGLTLFLAYSYLPEEQKQRFESSGTDKTSVARITYWKKGYEMLQDNPMTGVGYFNFADYFDYRYAEYKVYRNKSERAHNHVVEVAATLGYPGLTLYMLIIYGSYLMSVRARKVLLKSNLKHHWIYSFTVGMDCALVGYFIGAMFMSVAFYPYLWIHAAYVVAIYNVAKSVAESPESAVVETESVGK